MNFVLEFIHNCLRVILFKILIIIDEQDFTLEFNKFFEKTSLFSLDGHLNHAFFIDGKKAQLFKCAYFNFIDSKKSFQSFFNYFN